ncbi:MAG: aminotransferase class V-fold PLP-dependent enzyme [Thermodesulfobacteriota bacterium]|nr:aminotransferase class V-fold PLP-dependent enzyme [Thermodesulfobacteriota bacterium]
MMPIYCDQAATSFPKPKAVVEAISSFLTNTSGSPGRSAHRYAIEAGRAVFETRETVADFFNCPSSEQVIFTANVTESLNLVLSGLLQPGDHVVTTSMEHNSVMRPLQYLKESRKVDFTVVSCDDQGRLAPENIRKALRPETRLVVVNHASNVTGTILPIEAVGGIKGNALFLIDTAQSAGVIPIDMQKAGIDFLAFTGHKSLLGPTGIGGLCLSKDIRLNPLKRGGTGSRSESWAHPDFLPDRYESGTPNTVGIVGLNAGIKFIQEQGLERIRAHELRLIRQMMDGLNAIKGVKIYGPQAADEKTGIVSLNIEGKSPSEVCLIFDRKYGIMTRGGLHCAPIAHKTIGTFPNGTVRLSLGYFNTLEEVDQAIRAIYEISKM